MNGIGETEMEIREYVDFNIDVIYIPTGAKSQCCE